MKKIAILLAFTIFYFFASGQKELKSIDSTLKNINGNVSKLKDELVKKSPEPFTGQSIFEDREGVSAIFLPYGGTFKINTADASLKFSFTNYSIPIVTKHKYSKMCNKSIPIYQLKPFYGVEISGKTNDGIFNFISKGDISPGAKINGVLGKDIFNITRNKKCEDRGQILGTLILKAGYEGSSFKLFKPDTNFKHQISKVSFSTFTSSLAFNLKINGNILLALSVGYQKVNNYNDLDEIELSDQKTIKDSVTNTTRTYVTKTKARIGDYKTYEQIPVNFDFFWVLKNNPRLGFYHYWRTKLTNGTVTNGFGSGLFLLKKNNPLSSVAGIVFEVSDLSKLENDYGKNFTINFIVGYNFGFKNRSVN